MFSKFSMSVITFLLSASVYASPFFLYPSQSQFRSGERMDLKNEISFAYGRQDFQRMKIVRVEVSGEALEGRNGDFRNPPSSVFLNVMNEGSCQQNFQRLQRRFSSTVELFNPKPNDLSDGPWTLGFCGASSISQVVVHTVMRRRGGTTPRPNPIPGPTRPGPNVKKTVQADYYPNWVDLYDLYEDAHTVVIRNAHYNSGDIRLEGLELSVLSRRFGSQTVSLSQYEGTVLAPAQAIRILLPVARNGDQIRKVLDLAIRAKSYSFGGGDIIVEFDKTFRR